MSSLFGFFILLYVDLCMPLVGPKLEKIKFLILVPACSIYWYEQFQNCEL